MKIRKYPVTVTILWIMIEILDIVFTVISFSRINFSDKSDHVAAGLAAKAVK